MAHGEDVLRENEKLQVGEFLVSPNGGFYATMQSDGNFVVYRGAFMNGVMACGTKKAADLDFDQTNTHLWSWIINAKRDDKENPPLGVYEAVMQDDRNFVIYAQGGHPVWSARSYKAPGAQDAPAQARICDDGRLVVEHPGGGHGATLFDSKITDTLLTPLSKTGKFASEDVLALDYDLKPGHFQMTGTPKYAASQTADNETSVRQQSSMTLTYSKTITHSFTFKLGISITGTVSGKAGVPFVAEGKVSLSTSVSTDMTWSDGSSTTEAVSVTLPVVTPPGKRIVGRLLWTDSTLSIPYGAYLLGRFEGLSEPVLLYTAGSYSGPQSHDMKMQWAEVDAGTAIAGGTATGGLAGAAPAMEDHDWQDADPADLIIERQAEPAE